MYKTCTLNLFQTYIDIYDVLGGFTNKTGQICASEQHNVQQFKKMPQETKQNVSLEQN